MPAAVQFDLRLDMFVVTLAAERRRRRWSLTETAKKLECSASMLCQWENGHKPPLDVRLRRWAEVLELPVPDGVHGTFPTPPAECGSAGGRMRHQRAGEPACRECKAWKAADQAAYRAGLRNTPDE